MFLVVVVIKFSKLELFVYWYLIYYLFSSLLVILVRILYFWFMNICDDLKFIRNIKNEWYFDFILLYMY